MNHNINSNVIARTREKEFALKFNSSVEGFIYSRGYINSDKPSWVKCKACGLETQRSGGYLRKVVRGEKNIVCKQCKPNNNTNKSKLNAIRICKQCDNVFETKLNRTYCGEKCLGKSRNKRRNDRKSEIVKRLLANGLYDSSISLEKLIKKEKNNCYLCGGQCNSRDYIIDDKGSFIFGPNYPSIEHVIPVSKGGTHTWDNVKLAHHYCNSIKSNKTIIEDTGQLVLMI